MILTTLSMIDKKISRQSMANRQGVSQATISKNIKKLLIDDLIDVNVNVTEKGKMLLSNTKIDNAIFFAAGWGSRLYPITEKTPKPLVKVHGTPIIEQSIKHILSVGINNITIVTGKLHSQFDYLVEKFGVKLIFNDKWNKRQNIHSAFMARKELKNSIIIEGDTLIRDSLIIPTHIKDSLYFLTNTDSITEEWVLKMKGRNVVGRAKGSKVGGHQWKGIYFINKTDSNLINVFFKNKYTDDPKYWNSDFAWFIMDEFNYGHMRAYDIDDEDTYEIDTVDDLIKVDSSYKEWGDKDV